MSYKQSIYVKKQIHSLAKLCSSNEEVRERFLDEIDIDKKVLVTILVTFLNLITGYFESVEVPMQTILQSN